MAMLTSPLNIAVFAAFWPRVVGYLLSDAEFKPGGGDRPLDIWGYGWQKRQDVAIKWQRMVRWAAKTARCGGGAAIEIRAIWLARLPWSAGAACMSVCDC
jgi:hypothetical protein